MTAKVVNQSLPELSKRLIQRAQEELNQGNILFVLPAVGYSIIMIVYHIAYARVSYSLPTMFVLVVIPITVIVGHSVKTTRPWVPLVTIMLCYEGLWGAVGSFADTRTLLSVYPLDKMIWGFNVTGWVQSTFYSSAVTLVTSFFYSLQIPLVIMTSLVLWRFKRKVFGKFVSAIIMTSYAALVTFIIAPTVPPWYQGVAANLFSGGSASVLPGWALYLASVFESDKFAAFPSLHAAYAIIFSYFMVKLDRRLAFVSIPVTLAILFSTLYLGQHYLFDLLGGALYALVPCLIMERLQILTHGIKPLIQSPLGYSVPNSATFSELKLCQNAE